MKTKNILKYTLMLTCIWIAQACTEGFEEMNQDPKNPTQTTIPSLFNGVVSSLQLQYGELSAIHSGNYYFQSQQLGNANMTYAASAGPNAIWDNYFLTLKNVRLLESMLAEVTIGTLKMDNAKACLDILLVYTTLRMVDYMGDMPFFDAGKGGDGSAFFEVKYDKQQDIYKHCIELLEKASLALTTTVTDQYSYGTGDTFLKGNIASWKAFANSLLLRYAMQAANADAATYTPYIGMVLGDPAKYPVLGGASKAIGLWPKDLGNWVVDSHPWTYRENNNSCMGTAMWHTMSVNDNTDGSGIFDPRCYVFFESNNAGEWKAYPQNPDAGTPVQDRGPYLTTAYPNGRNKGATQQEWGNKGTGCRYSPVNFYLATNDDFIPEIMVTAAEVHFLTAEAYNRGIGVAKDAAKAQAAYEAGIRSSLRFWYDQVVTPCTMWVVNKPTITVQQVDDYVTRMAYSSNEATALQQIYTQLWIDSFRQPWVGFNLYRRTLATPRDETGAYNPNSYNYYKVIYPESERLYNAANYVAATGDKDGNANTSDKKLFWQK